MSVTRARVPVALVGPTTWSNLQIFSAPITSAPCHHHLGTHLRARRRCGGSKCGCRRMDGWSGPLFFSLWSSFCRPLARTPVPMRLRDPERESPGRAMEISAAPPRDSLHASPRAGLVFALSSHKKTHSEEIHGAFVAVEIAATSPKEL